MGKSLEANLHLNGVGRTRNKRKSTSLHSLRTSLLRMNTKTGQGWGSYSEVNEKDPLQQLRQDAHRKIRARVVRERNLAMIMCLLVTVFMLCFLPFWSLYICLAFCQTCHPPPHTALAMAQWLALSSSLINPVLYTVFNKDFRRAIKNTLLLCLPPS